MTQSGGRAISPEQFLRNLARTPGISQRRFIQQARQAGIRFSNDVFRGIFNSLKNLELTGNQRIAVTKTALRLSLTGRKLLLQGKGVTKTDIKQVSDKFGNFLTELLTSQLPNIMVRVNYRVSARVGFIWESGSADNGETFVSIPREVTISLDQLDSFNDSLSNFGSTHTSALIDIGASELGLDSSYGEYIFTEAPSIEVTDNYIVGQE